MFDWFRRLFSSSNEPSDQSVLTSILKQSARAGLSNEESRKKLQLGGELFPQLKPTLDEIERLLEKYSEMERKSKES